MSASPRVVRVVPDLATFAVDEGFAYSLPDGVDAPVGSIVRVPLGGRRVRGWVVAEETEARPRLRDVLGRSGDLEVFGPGLLSVLRWAALHYVAPLAALLSKPTPPNLPRRGPGVDLPPVPSTPASPLPEVTAAAVAGEHTAARYLMGGDLGERALAGLAGPVLAAGRSVLVVLPSLSEAAETVEALASRFGHRVILAASGLGGAAATAAWVAAASAPGRILVGTRETAFWPVSGLALVCVMDEGRRAMKDKSTPTTHVREVLWRRAAVARFPLVFLGPVPTAEAVYRGTVPVPAGGRPWGLVEIVDRTEDPPGSGLLTARTRQALLGVARGGGRAFVFTDRRVAAVRCVKCRALRTCPGCGARPDRSPECVRCGRTLGPCAECGGGRFEPLGAPVERVIAEAAGVLGPEAVGEPGSGRPILVGTERDLPGLPGLDLGVVVDADGLLRAPHYRNSEEALRLMARVVVAASGGRGRRAIVQTADPGHEVFAALRRAEPVPFLEAEIRTRAASGFPPAGELIVLEAADAPGESDSELRTAVGAGVDVHGPSLRRERSRWLLQARDLRTARLALRRLVQDWRDRGARVRVDADPLDL